jgi:Tfp pilus assembly protein PilX
MSPPDRPQDALRRAQLKAAAVNAHRPAAQRGVTMLVVLVLLSVMLLGGLALARMTEVGSLVSGNSNYREASLQASEVGLNSAYEAVKALSNEEAQAGNWYWPTTQSADTTGIPSVSWTNAPQIAVGSYSVSYVVERMCNTAPVTNTLRQCLVKQEPQLESASFGKETPDPPNSRQFRITVRVSGPKETQTWVQALVTKG